MKENEFYDLILGLSKVCNNRVLYINKRYDTIFFWGCYYKFKGIVPQDIFIYLFSHPLLSFSLSAHGDEVYLDVYSYKSTLEIK